VTDPAATVHDSKRDELIRRKNAAEHVSSAPCRLESTSWKFVLTRSFKPWTDDRRQLCTMAKVAALLIALIPAVAAFQPLGRSTPLVRSMGRSRVSWASRVPDSSWRRERKGAATTTKHGVSPFAGAPHLTPITHNPFSPDAATAHLAPPSTPCWCCGSLDGRHDWARR